MRTSYSLGLFLVLATLSPAFCEEESAKRQELELARQDKISKVANEQDELQADVQELVAEQTAEGVISLLEECQDAMNDAIDGLEEFDTGGSTIAAQTEVIEKIFQAAEKKSEGSGNNSMQGMLEMLRSMMNSSENSSGDSKEEKGNKNDTPGMGADGEGSIRNTPIKGNTDGEKKEPRRLPKSSGSAGMEYPREFSSAMSAYNKTLSEKTPPNKESATPPSS